MKSNPSLGWIADSIGSFTMDIPYTTLVTFTNLKWIGSSNQANFKFSASTVLNGAQNSSTVFENIWKKISQYSIKELYDIVMNDTLLPLSTGLEVAKESARELLNLSESLLQQYKTSSSMTTSLPTSNTDSLFGNIEKSINLFSNTYSFLESLKAILKTANKNAITDKIYVTSRVRKIEVVKFSKTFQIRDFVLKRY